MKKVSLFLSTLLVTSIFVVVNASQAEDSFAEETFTHADEAVAAQSSGDVGAQGSEEVTAASGSNRFVVWYDSTPGNDDILFKRSTDAGATWKATVNLSTNPGSSKDPQIAVSGSNVYVVWEQHNSVANVDDTFFRRSTDNGATWGSKVKISANSIDTDNVNLIQVAASGSSVYIVWVDAPAPFEILIRRSTDGGATWKPVVNLSSNAGSSSSPRIAVSASNVYVVWSDATPGNYDIFLKRSTDNGATWKPTVNLSNNAGNSFSTQIGV